MKKFFIVTTIPLSLRFFEGQYQFLKEAFDITALSSDRQKLTEFGNSHDILVHHIPMWRGISPLRDIYSLLCLCRFFTKEQPYIVHGNTPKASFLSMIAAKIAGVSVRIYMCHGLRYQSCSGILRRLLVLTERITCRCATDILCVSNGLKDLMISEKISDKEPTVIWNGSVSGIDIDKFNPNKGLDRTAIRSRFGLAPGDFVVTFVGRLVRDKGINELVEAFSSFNNKYPNSKLLLVGPLEKQGNGLSNKTLSSIYDNRSIIAAGLQESIPEILSATDVFIFPTYREGFGLALMEAGAMGIPSIATNIIGCNEIIENEKTGLLIQPYSSVAIEKAVERLYNDKSLYESIHRSCRNSIISRYEQRHLWSLYRDYYLSR